MTDWTRGKIESIATRVAEAGDAEAAKLIRDLLAVGIEAEQEAIDATTALEAAREDAIRLDFVLENSAWIRSKKADSGAMTYWLETQDEDENHIRLSGPGFHCIPRAAIDAARKEVGSE